MNTLPKDPILLFSVINTRLRDFYPSLEALCEDLAINPEQLKADLARAGYLYDPARNAFV